MARGLKALDTNLNFMLHLFTLYYCSIHCIDPAFAATRNKPYYKSYKIRIKIVLLARPVFFCLHFVSGVCSVVFDCFWLSVPVQLIAWKDLSLK